jgi:required for meiotic nuclear division protein 1
MRHGGRHGIDRRGLRALQNQIHPRSGSTEAQRSARALQPAAARVFKLRAGTEAFGTVLHLRLYGSVVFFNVPDEVAERELEAIHEYRLPTEAGRATDLFLMEVAGPPAGAGSARPRIFFDRIVVSELSPQLIKIVCMLLAESTALEYYEALIENLLEKTNKYSKKLHRQGRMLESSEDLIKFIGMCLDTKQEIISNLYIVDSPDETWENVELDRVHQELKTMMEVDTRYRALEYKIKIIQESVEIIVDLSKSRRETLLETVIILLIAFEIVLSIVKH